MSLSPSRRKLAPSTPDGSLEPPSRQVQHLAQSRCLVRAWVLLGSVRSSTRASVSPSLKWECSEDLAGPRPGALWQQRRCCDLHPRSSHPHPSRGFQLRPHPSPGEALAPHCLRERGSSQEPSPRPGVALAAQWSRRLGPASAAPGASFVCSPAPGARGPRPASRADKAGAAASLTGWSGARSTHLPP